jgi:hypothetical protein
MDLSDAEFSTALKSVESDFFGMNYSELGVVRHVAGIFLWLSKIGLMEKARNEILEFSCFYIDYLKEVGKLNSEVSNRPRFREYESWGGLGFHEKESDEMKVLNKYIDQLSEQAVIEDYPTAGDELIFLISEDPNLFYRKVVLCNDVDNIYYEIPIFQYTDPEKFVDAFVSAIPDSRNTICYAFSERYKSDYFKASLLPELKWLRNVIKLLEKKRQLFEGKISGYQLQSYINTYFRPAAEALEQFEANKQSQSDS